MFRYFQIFFFALLASIWMVACSDDAEGVEYKFDRETSEMSVLRQCADGADSGAYCFQLRFRIPIETEHLDSFYIWVDSTVVGDTAKAVSNSKLSKATAVFPYKGGDAKFDTIDLTSYIQEYVEEGRDSLMVGLFCGYSDDKDPGSVQRVYLHFGDDIDPSLVNFSEDSTWTTGAQFEWYRPSDQTDYYKPNILNGPIAGYNIIIRAENADEDIRDLKVTVISSAGTDSTGDKLYKRHARINANSDSMWVASFEHGDNRKNELRLLIYDGLGIDTADNEQNRFRLIIEGLKAESAYTRGLVAYDSAGNYSGVEGAASDLFNTTDSIAPLMPTAVFTMKDTLYPEMTRLDSNNRVLIYWSRSVDPVDVKHGIKEDSVLIFPNNCYYLGCYDTVASYVIDYYDAAKKDWKPYSYAGGAGRHSTLFAMEGDSMVVDPDGKFVTDTIRWVAPGDTLIIRIRSKDPSGYYSKALVDTIVVSPGELASQVECPAGFIAVKTDSSVFCMEKYEHQDEDGNFVTNVLHSEAKAACEAISASGFTVSLCGEKDWQDVCLSGGTYSYGVVVDDSLSAEEYLYSYCNVRSGVSTMAEDLALRNPRCVSPMGVHDFPGQLQEWVLGRSEDTLAVIRGGSYMIFGGLDREAQALCTTRSFPYFTRPAYTQDTIYLYREGTRVDTVYSADTSRTLYAMLTQKDFTDSLQFFDVQDSNGNSIGTDYALYSEYKNGGDEWLDTLAGNLKYVPDHVEVVFLTGEKVAYRHAAAFYKSPAIGFRCCAYPE